MFIDNNQQMIPSFKTKQENPVINNQKLHIGCLFDLLKGERPGNLPLVLDTFMSHRD